LLHEFGQLLAQNRTCALKKHGLRPGGGKKHAKSLKISQILSLLPLGGRFSLHTERTGSILC
jgi:hypothetical protein